MVLSFIAEESVHGKTVSMKVLKNTLNSSSCLISLFERDYFIREDDITIDTYDKAKFLKLERN